MPEDCSNCKHHSASMRPKVVSEVFDTLVEFADDDETIFHCRIPDGPRAGQEIGRDPVRCDAYAPGTKGVGDALDVAMKRWQSRAGSPSHLDKE